MDEGRIMNNDKSDDGRPESGQSGHDRSAERRGIIEAANDIFSGGKVFTHYSTGQQRSSKSDASRGYAEAPMKLIADACRYIEETDDLSILNEYCVSSVPGTEPKLMIFCLYESFRYSLFNRGRHDLPLVKYTAQPSGTVSGDTAPQLVESIDAAETFVSCAAAYAGLCRRLSKINEHDNTRRGRPLGGDREEPPRQQAFPPLPFQQIRQGLQGLPAGAAGRQDRRLHFRRQGFHVLPPFAYISFIVGSSASRSPSATRLNESIRSAITMIGGTI